jgi:hypothetical protein
MVCGDAAEAGGTITDQNGTLFGAGAIYGIVSGWAFIVRHHFLIYMAPERFGAGTMYVAGKGGC